MGNQRGRIKGVEGWGVEEYVMNSKCTAWGGGGGQQYVMNS